MFNNYKACKIFEKTKTKNRKDKNNTIQKGKRLEYEKNKIG